MMQGIPRDTLRDTPYPCATCCFCASKSIWGYLGIPYSQKGEGDSNIASPLQPCKKVGGKVSLGIPSHCYGSIINGFQRDTRVPDAAQVSPSRHVAFPPFPPFPWGPPGGGRPGGSVDRDISAPNRNFEIGNPFSHGSYRSHGSRHYHKKMTQ